MSLFLREADVEGLLTMEIALEAVEEAMKEAGLGRAVNQPRSRIMIKGASLQLLSAALPARGVMGYKAYTTFRGGVRFLVYLYSSETGALLAVMEADKLGQMRTGAASGVATKYMGREDARMLGVIGAGWQALAQIEAVCKVRRIELATVYSRDAGRREAFAQRMTAQLGVPVEPASSARSAVEGADVVIVATNAAQPVLEGEWLKPGVHINAVGANSLLRRELDDKVIQRAGAIVADSKEQARLEAADLVFPIERGALQWGRIHELGAVVAGTVAGRRSEDEITLFKSLGLALWDVAVAQVIYRLALQKGIGEELPL